jgi:hypothetical protein
MRHNVVVVEGPSGSGKSTVIQQLKRYFDWPVYRPFRTVSHDHAPGQLEPALGILKVPTNTWMEDVYVADAIMGLGSSAYLDRSMPSALAYDAMGKGTGLTENERVLAMSLWARRMVAANALVIQLMCHADECSGRSGRFAPDFCRTEAEAIGYQINIAGELHVPVVKLYTGKGADVNEQVYRYSRVIDGTA